MFLSLRFGYGNERRKEALQFDADCGETVGVKARFPDGIKQDCSLKLVIRSEAIQRSESMGLFFEILNFSFKLIVVRTKMWQTPICYLTLLKLYELTLPTIMPSYLPPATCHLPLFSCLAVRKLKTKKRSEQEFIAAHLFPCMSATYLC